MSSLGWTISPSPSWPQLDGCHKTNHRSWTRFFHWLHRLQFCISLPGMLKRFYCSPNSFSTKLKSAILKLRAKEERALPYLFFYFCWLLEQTYLLAGGYVSASLWAIFGCYMTGKEVAAGWCCCFFLFVCFFLLFFFNPYFSGVSNPGFWSTGTLPEVHMEIFAMVMEFKKRNKQLCVFKKLYGNFRHSAPIVFSNNSNALP